MREFENAMSLLMDMTASILIGALLPLFSSCASGGAAECPEVRQPVAPAPPASSAAASSSSVVIQPSASAPVTIPGSAPVSSAPLPAAPGSAPAPSAANAGPPLPELKVHLAGMHIGGGPNDESSKRPLIRAIEDAYEPLRVCYRKAEDPEHGGTFGVDLKIAGKGGTAEIQQVRTALKGEKLRECLTGVFKGIQFAPPPKGPTIVSVSVRFSLGS